MAGPSSTVDELQQQLDEYNTLAEMELRKGAQRDLGLLGDLQREREILLAQIDRQTSGEVQHHGSVLCCQAPLASG